MWWGRQKHSDQSKGQSGHVRPSGVNPLVSCPSHAPVTRHGTVSTSSAPNSPLCPGPETWTLCLRPTGVRPAPLPRPFPPLSALAECFIKHLHTAVECQGSSVPEREHLGVSILPGSVSVYKLCLWPGILPPALGSPSAQLRPAPSNTPATRPRGQGSQAPEDFRPQTCPFFVGAGVFATL